VEEAIEFDVRRRHNRRRSGGFFVAGTVLTHFPGNVRVAVNTASGSLTLIMTLSSPLVKRMRTPGAPYTGIHNMLTNPL
jgi:hypothetical protein